MAKKGNAYDIAIKDVHMNWGTKRQTQNRAAISGEGYIPIPSQKATEFGVFNSNALKNTNPKVTEKLGVNLFNCFDQYGFVGQVKATGTSQAGNVYAKQFSGFDNLKLIGEWFQKNNISVGQSINVRWTSSTEMFIQ